MNIDTESTALIGIRNIGLKQVWDFAHSSFANFAHIKWATERFPQVVQDKWETVSESLRSLQEMSDVSESLISLRGNEKYQKWAIAQKN